MYCITTQRENKFKTTSDQRRHVDARLCKQHVPAGYSIHASIHTRINAVSVRMRIHTVQRRDSHVRAKWRCLIQKGADYYEAKRICEAERKRQQRKSKASAPPSKNLRQSFLTQCVTDGS